MLTERRTWIAPLTCETAGVECCPSCARELQSLMQPTRVALNFYRTED